LRFLEEKIFRGGKGSKRDKGWRFCRPRKTKMKKLKNIFKIGIDKRKYIWYNKRKGFKTKPKKEKNDGKLPNS
jgi:hypothetical protein